MSILSRSSSKTLNYFSTFLSSATWLQNLAQPLSHALKPSYARRARGLTASTQLRIIFARFLKRTQHSIQHSHITQQITYLSRNKHTTRSYTLPMIAALEPAFAPQLALWAIRAPAATLGFFHFFVFSVKG